MKTLHKSILYFLFFLTSSFVAQNYIYQEEFYSQGTWTQANNDIRELYVSNGKYYFEHKKSDGFREFTTRSFYLDFSKDFEIETSILKVSGVQGFGMSFLYDYKDSNNYSEFGITSSGYYRVAESNQGKYSNIKSWTSSSYINKNNNSTNKLKIKKVGNRVTFYLNNSYVYGTDFKTFKGSKIGLRLYKNQKVAIDYIRVKQQKSTNNFKNNTGSKTILFEGFNNNNNNWSTKDDANCSLQITNGDYILNHKRATGGWSSTIYKTIDTSRDFYIAADIKKSAGILNNGYGIVFGRKDNDNQHHFLISGDGSYKISKYENGTRTYIKDWTKSSSIKQGNGSRNYLKIQKSGSAYKFYINTTLVYTDYNIKFYGQRVGFIAYDSQTIRISYLSLMYASGSSIVKKNTNNHTAKETIIFDGYTDNRNNWSTSKSSDADLEIRNGNYYFNHKRDNGGWSSTIVKEIDTSRDFKILADIKKESGIQNNGYGISFGRLNGNNQNVFYVNGNGSFCINKIKNGQNNYKKQWVSSSAIRKGNGSYNILKVVKVGSKLEYYINNTKVYTDYSPEFFGDRLGYVVYDRQEISVGYLSVGYLNKKENTNYNNNTNISDNIQNFNYNDSKYFFSDQFTNNTNNWYEGNDDKREFKVENGKYYLSHKRNEKGWSVFKKVEINTSKDFEIETKIDKISGVTNYAYGLVFGAKQDYDFRFYISSGGYYKVSRLEENKEQIIQKWTKTSLINTGNSKSNTLKVKKENNYYKFYINGSYVYQTDFEEFYGNEIGYVVYNNQKIGIDYVRVKYNTNNNTTIAKKVNLKAPLNDQFNNNSSSWILEDNKNYAVNLNSGKLKINRKTKGGIFISRTVDINTSKDFIIETAISHTNTSSGYYGFTFGRKNSSNEFTFLLSGNGSYKYRKFENDEYKEIIPSTFSDAIKTNNNQNNVVKIVKSGATLRFYINNQYVNETPYESFFGNKLGYTVYHDRKITVDYLKIDYQTDSFNNPPVIVITEPDVRAKRGFKIVKTKRITVKGRATDSDGIYEILVNGVEANVSADGTFTANVPLKYGGNKLVVSAVDLKQAKSNKEFQIIRETSQNVNNTITNVEKKADKIDIGFGKYYALIIGVSDYDDPKVADLGGEPTKDAQALADVLTTYYNFEKSNITVLKNPTDSDIKKEFVLLRKKVTKNDNVLIFYAGHGNYNTQSEYGYWMPANVEMEYEGNVILNEEIVTYLRTIKSKNTLLISDACFSGSILVKSRAYSDASKAVQIKHDTESRKAITSGTLTTVPNKSVFMKYLLRQLKENKNPYLSAMELYHLIEVPVINNSAGENPPKPVYAPISQTGDMGGDFYFIKRN